ncbi:L-type lectin-domain containing protein [Rhodovulum sp. DZ06]|uniref:L-type lectin-domain containing protein n=1 Tax=Rhodovulum sp. DZ06 TaxID=3425126 RepID=UPI003D3442C4
MTALRRPLAAAPLAALLAAPAAAQGAGDLRLTDFLDASRLTLSGAAAVGEDGALTLTPAQGWMSGSVFSSAQISTKAFSTYFAFRMDRPGGGGADGIALIAQTASASLGENGGGMGYEGVPNSLAVEFDTWRNGWDRSDNHTGLLINGDVRHRDFGPVDIEAPFEAGETWHAWLDYDGCTLELRLSRAGLRPPGAVFAHPVDIPALLGSETAFVGFAAATGAAWARHEILAWTYLERYAPGESGDAMTSGTAAAGDPGAGVEEEEASSSSSAAWLGAAQRAEPPAPAAPRTPCRP